VVAHSRTPLGAHTLRALNGARPLTIQIDAAGQPIAVRQPDWPAPRPVLELQDCWRIDDEWWRQRPISRLYYQLVMTNGQLLTIYHDLVEDSWFEQRG